MSISTVAGLASRFFAERRDIGDRTPEIRQPDAALATPACANGGRNRSAGLRLDRSYAKHGATGLPHPRIALHSFP